MARSPAATLPKSASAIFRRCSVPDLCSILVQHLFYVGPSLGADSIRHGVRAAIVGMVAVMVFMLIYTDFPG